MPWPVTVNGNNYQLSDFSPYGYTNAFPNIINDISAVAQAVQDSMVAAGYSQVEATIASAATTDIGAGTAVKQVITGTTAITSFGTQPNRLRFIRFAAALTLTHNATSLVLPNAANLTTAAGDTAIATSDASGNWRVRAYQRAVGVGALAQTDPAAFGSLTVNGGTTNANRKVDVVGQVRVTAPNGQVQIDTSTAGQQALYQMYDAGSLRWQFGKQTDNTFFLYDVVQNYFPIATGTTPGTFFFNIGSGSGNVGVGGATAPNKFSVAGIISHTVDNTYSLGSASYRATIVYAATGTINTSDAREKTPVGRLSEAEIGWAQDLAREIGHFRFLASVEEKGDRARIHIGLTVQRAIELGCARGLDPLHYAFICHDTWDETPAVPPTDPVEEVRDEETGEIVTPAMPGLPGEPARPAGDRYGFRPDQLALFIAAGQEARLAALEDKVK